MLSIIFQGNACNPVPCYITTEGFKAQVLKHIEAGNSQEAKTFWDVGVSSHGQTKTPLFQHAPLNLSLKC